MMARFERFVGLQTNDLLQALVDIAGIVSGNGGGQVGIKIDRRVSAVLDLDAFHDLVPQLGGSFGRASQEGLVTFIRGVVLLDEVTGVDRGLPFTGCEAFPCFWNCSLSSAIFITSQGIYVSAAILNDGDGR